MGWSKISNSPGITTTPEVNSSSRVLIFHFNWLYFPRRRLIVNLAPAAVRKEGPAYDLPIALGALIASRQIPPESVDGALIIGELSLDGSVRPVRGATPRERRAGHVDNHRVVGGPAFGREDSRHRRRVWDSGYRRRRRTRSARRFRRIRWARARW